MSYQHPAMGFFQFIFAIYTVYCFLFPIWMPILLYRILRNQHFLREELLNKDNTLKKSDVGKL
jgi:hypothetical protein